MDIHTIQAFATHNILLGQLVIFFGMLMTNIIPLMFFIYPEVFIFISVFLIQNGILPWYIPWGLLIMGAFIGEYISFFIGKKYGIHILDHKFFQKDLSKKWIQKLNKNGVKTFIIGKELPGIGWIIPVLSGITKMDTKKFLLWDFIMVTNDISLVFIFWLLGLHFAEEWFGKKVWFILGGILIIYIIGHLIYKFKFKKYK